MCRLFVVVVNLTPLFYDLLISYVAEFSLQLLIFLFCTIATVTVCHIVS